MSRRAAMLQSPRKKVPMVTLKLNKSSRKTADPRTPVRGAGSAPRVRPTLAQAQEQRQNQGAEREARYQDQLRQRFGNNTPPAFNRAAPPASPQTFQTRADRPRTPQRETFPAHQQNRGSAPRQQRQEDPRGPIDPRRQAFEPRYQNEQRHPQPQPQPQPQQQRRPDQPAQFRASVQPQAPTDFRDRNARDNRPPAPPDAARKRAPQRQRLDRDDVDTAPVADPNSMRLSKRMSELGIASRREADEWIPKGWVRVDGRVVCELGSRVLPAQQITVDAKARFVQAQKVTVILNKPIGYVSGQAEDGYEPAVVLIKPANQWREDQSGTRYLLTHLRGIAPAGRLDIDSVGLLVLTQDGRIAKQLIGEDSEMEKEYLVRVELAAAGEAFSDAKLALLNHGLELDGEALRPALVEWINEDQLRFVLKEGKKRQIRRMCEAVGLKVTGLKRVRIGNVMLGDLPVGAWRYLRGDESFVPLRPPTSE